MKILLDMGHTLSGADTGAEGCGRREQDCTREIGYKFKAKLEALGHTVVVCSKDSCSSLNDSLSYRANTANNAGGDLYLAIHLNAFNGAAYGTEVYTYGGKEFTEAKNVLANIVALGYRNRGIKDGSHLYVIKNTSMKSMLVECCFIDNQSDMGRYNADNFANAIVKGITGTTVNTPEESPQEHSPNEDYSCKGKYGVATGDGVRLRDGASTNSNVLGYANKGDKFKIGYKLGDWYSVYWGEHGAFISASYLSISSNNSSNNWIARLQEECNNQGFSNQTVDGYAGPNTLDGCPLVKPGAQGNITKLIQERLISLGYNVSCGADGIFGNGTKQAVIQFQQDNGLSADGIVGRNTWRALLGL